MLNCVEAAMSEKIAARVLCKVQFHDAHVHL